MIQSRLIQLYLTLNKAELRQLKRWINSPIHNQNQEVVKLFDYLSSRRKITKVTVLKKRVFNAVYPNELYHEAKQNILMSYALKSLKEFIGYNLLVLEGFNLNKSTIESLKNRQLDQMATQELQKLKATKANSPLSNAEETLQYFLLEKEAFELVGTQQRTIQTNLPILFEHLTDFYSIATLKYACIAMTHRNVRQQEYSIPMLDSLLIHAQENKHPIVQLYYNAYQALIQLDKEAYFQKAEQLFLVNNDKLNASEKRGMLLILINYCIKRINMDAKAYQLKVFEWYKWGLEQGALLYHKKLSRFTYLNITSAGLKLKEFDWVAQFIKNYANYLPTAYKANYVHYTTAKLYFNKKKYYEAQQLLQQIEYDDIFLNLDAKTMLLEIYYEEKSIDALEALLGSFTRYLQRNSIIAYHKKVYQNIIYLIQKMIDTPSYDKKAQELLKKEIETLTPLTERDWFLKQIAKITTG
ncbi:hypothetical protein [Aureispira anguillae]|uniref:Uncharacterized protein n=1 Tax=Aureispira anguillae TaxID=2864201 RepID=A0A916DSJ6_9BACT|nr:hypothetical protein [Aureispira anguillae]BDS11112.1 hypothetical protein AsAng_0018230 [Aureispira anguillae]